MKHQGSLEANGLLHHPEYGVAVTLADCEELADSLGEPDGWSVAARFAAEVLPGIFKPSDPAVRITLAREDLIALEKVVIAIESDVFSAEDSLGWVYQFWQSKAKDAVNASGRKIGGADLSPVTQLFTENYMVRFLLENSLGAWWARRNPASPLVPTFSYLRLDDSGLPAAGEFPRWPDTAAKVTVMDPSCGSGHFVVAAFGMLWRMRAEEEGLSPVEAQDAVLAENLFGLELDQRCTQLAMFALAVEAWKQGGYRELPVPRISCSGIPAKAPVAEWLQFAAGDSIVEAALARLHALFKEADTLGSLIDPVRAAEQAGLESVEWSELSPLVLRVLASEDARESDTRRAVFRDAAASIAQAADLLSRSYTLVGTNVPYLARWRQSTTLQDFLERGFPASKTDLATAFIESMLRRPDQTVAVVAPQNWLFQTSYEDFRKLVLDDCTVQMVAQLGEGGFVSSAAAGAFVGLFIISSGRDAVDGISSIDATREPDPVAKSAALRAGDVIVTSRGEHRRRAGACIILAEQAAGRPLAEYVEGTEGLSTGDGDRFVMNFWEVSRSAVWEPLQGSPLAGLAYEGLNEVVRWEDGTGELARSSAARIQGRAAWGREGILIGRVRTMRAGIHLGYKFDKSCVVFMPRRKDDLAAVYAYCTSPEFDRDVRQVDASLKVTISSLVKVPFDAPRWRKIAEESFPDGLPKQSTQDPTQWLFRGSPRNASDALQVAVARLVGFAWPEQDVDEIDALVDGDGIVCLPAIAGEQAASERVRAVMATGGEFSHSTLDELLSAAGGRLGELTGWLTNSYFKDHCRVFGNRPFVWHIWDGLKDGFSALVNYHNLDRATLEKLTYRTLGWWIDRQRADAESGVLGADARLGAAQALQAKLQLILEGEPPYDIYVRWKSLAEQPIGWDPDLDDGVRVNIRPFVEAGVLRSKFTIHWKKDRGANPDGSERHNDLHYSVAEKRTARGLT